jgi:hypothetical protein
VRWTEELLLFTRVVDVEGNVQVVLDRGGPTRFAYSRRRQLRRHRVVQALLRPPCRGRLPLLPGSGTAAEPGRQDGQHQWLAGVVTRSLAEVSRPMAA